MTLDEIRSNQPMRESLRAAIKSSAFIDLLLALEGSIGGEEVPDNADALTSVRVLSRQQGERAMLQKIKEVVLPLLPESTEDVPDFGTNLPPEELEAAYSAV